MKLMPRFGRRRSVRFASSGSSGSPQMPAPVTRMAPKPSRLTTRSPPMVNEPAAAALNWLMSVPVFFATTVFQPQVVHGLLRDEVGSRYLCPPAERVGGSRWSPADDYGVLQTPCHKMQTTPAHYTLGG